MTIQILAYIIGLIHGFILGLLLMMWYKDKQLNGWLKQ